MLCVHVLILTRTWAPVSVQRWSRSTGPVGSFTSVFSVTCSNNSAESKKQQLVSPKIVFGVFGGYNVSVSSKPSFPQSKVCFTALTHTRVFVGVQEVAIMLQMDCGNKKSAEPMWLVIFKGWDRIYYTIQKESKCDSDFHLKIMRWLFLSLIMNKQKSRFSLLLCFISHIKNVNNDLLNSIYTVSNILW